MYGRRFKGHLWARAVVYRGLALVEPRTLNPKPCTLQPYTQRRPHLRRGLAVRFGSTPGTRTADAQAAEAHHRDGPGVRYAKHVKACTFRICRLCV